MATWKKIVVSGSGVSQLSNDSNYLTTSGDGANLTNLTFGNITGREEGIEDIVNGLIVGGTNITATYDDAAGTLTLDADLTGDITSVGAGAGLTGGGTTGAVTVNVIGGDGITVGADEVEVAVDGTTIELSASNGSGVVQVKAGGIGTTEIADDSVTNAKIGAGAVGTTEIGDEQVTNDKLADNAVGTDEIADDAVTAAKLANTAVTAGSYGSATAVPTFTVDDQGRLTAAGTATISTTFNVSADTGTTDAVAGGETLAFEGGLGVTTTVSSNKIAIDIAGGIVSASSFTSPNQGTVRATLNGVNADVDTGLQASDSPTFAGITISNNAVINGDLTVSGTTTTLNTTNSALKDKFILLNSGSADPDEGGLIVDAGGGAGAALIYDAGDARWGFNASVNATATTANSEAYAAAVLDEDNVAHDVDAAAYQKRGNIKVDSSDDIFIYV